MLPPAARFPHAIEVGDRLGVDHRSASAGAGELEEVAEQAEAGDVSGRGGARLEGRDGGVEVQGGHDVDGLLEHFAGLLVTVVQYTQARSASSASAASPDARHHYAAAGQDSRRR